MVESFAQVTLWKKKNRQGSLDVESLLLYIGQLRASRRGNLKVAIESSHCAHLKSSQPWLGMSTAVKAEMIITCAVPPRSKG